MTHKTRIKAAVNMEDLIYLLATVRTLRDVDLIQSNSFNFLVTIDYFLGKKHIKFMHYASTQPEGELLSNRYGTRTTQHIHVRSDNEC